MVPAHRRCRLLHSLLFCSVLLMRILHSQVTARDLVTGALPDINTAMRQLQEKTEKYIESEKKK